MAAAGAIAVPVEPGFGQVQKAEGVCNVVAFLLLSPVTDLLRGGLDPSIFPSSLGLGGVSYAGLTSSQELSIRFAFDFLGLSFFR